MLGRHILVLLILSVATGLVGFVSAVNPIGFVTHSISARDRKLRHGDEEKLIVMIPPDDPKTGMVSAVATLALSMQLLLGVIPPAFAHGDVTRGSELFSGNCASCHAGGMNVINEKRTLKKEALEKFVGLDETSVQKFVQSSLRHKTLIFPGVPGGKLTDEDYSDVVSFIVDQAKEDKW